TIQTIPAKSDCHNKYGNLADRWQAVFTTKRDIKVARRLLFDDNYSPNQITSFVTLQNPQASSVMPSPKKRDSFGDLGGKEFFEETINLENIPIDNQEQKPVSVEERRLTAKSPAPSPKFSKFSVKLKPVHHDHLQIVVPRPMNTPEAQLRFYER
ncbi:hypothetical protein BVRB_030950, partial [Beta vulgaris subsp. vulgaris]